MTKLVIASRLHLGRASSPPDKELVQNVLTNLGSMAMSVEKLNDNLEAFVVIAVDATPKIEGYNYVDNIQSILSEAECSEFRSYIQILPVTPWGKFVPALNSLVLHAKSLCQADLILFVSAEVKASAATIYTLCQHVLASTASSGNVIAAGAALNGHEYAEMGNTVALGGRYENEHDSSPKGRYCFNSKILCFSSMRNYRTTPWNTLCVWNLDMLSLTGFLAVSDQGVSAGIEECVAIAVLQKLFPNAIAKLVQVPEIVWEESFEGDAERQKWHEQKMKSKGERATLQMNRLNLSGTVLHC
jgi:hypothetical protein